MVVLNICLFSPLVGEDEPILTNIFKGLKPPTRLGRGFRYYLCRSICLRKKQWQKLMDMLWLLTPDTWYLIVKGYLFTTAACNETWMALFQGVGSVKPSAFSSAYEYVNVLLLLHLYSYEQCCHSYLLPIYICIQPRLSQTSFLSHLESLKDVEKNCNAWSYLYIFGYVQMLEISAISSFQA